MIKKIFPDYSYLFLLISCIICSFIWGRFSVNKSNKIVTTTSTQQVAKVQTQIQTQAVIQKDSTQAQQTIVVTKTYSSNGKVATSTFTESKYNDKSLVSDYVSQSAQIQSLTTTDTQTKTIVSNQTNWLVGAYMPVNDYKDPQKLTMEVAYRLIGPVYISAMCDVKFTTPQIGIMIEF